MTDHELIVALKKMVIMMTFTIIYKMYWGKVCKLFTALYYFGC